MILYEFLEGFSKTSKIMYFVLINIDQKIEIFIIALNET